ncbi:hypothetical protein IWW34DRAFT_642587, partial [Fusarium oxysporum f. sp. albedinis]
PLVIEATISKDGKEDVLDMEDKNDMFLRTITERLEDNNDESPISMRHYKDVLEDSACDGYCIDLLENIFKLSSRITAAEALQHHWLREDQSSINFQELEDEKRTSRKEDRQRHSFRYANQHRCVFWIGIDGGTYLLAETQIKDLRTITQHETQFN